MRINTLERDEFLYKSFTYHGAVHDGDGRTPVLLQTEGKYEIRGSVFSIMETIWPSIQYGKRERGDFGR